MAMSLTSPEPTSAPLPLRRRNPPINPSGKPSRANLVSLVVIAVGFIIALGAPSLVVSPSQPSAALGEVVTAFALTAVGVAISLVAGGLAYRRTRDYGWLIATGVPAVALVAGGAILAATKVIT